MNILVLAFHFPPIAAAGTHRTVNFVRCLVQRGHRVGVITTSSFAGLARDAGLADSVPADVQILRTRHVDPYLVLHELRARRGREHAPSVPRGDGAPPVNGTHDASHASNGAGSVKRARRRAGPIREYLSRLFEIPDRYASWIPGAFAAGVVLGKRIGADVVYSTAPPYSAHVAARGVAAVLGVPWIADLRDPWADNPFKSNPYRSLKAIDAALEGAVLRGAARIVCNTEAAAAGFRARRPELADRVLTIPNGIDPLLLEPVPPRVEANGEVRLLHAGAVYGRRSAKGLVAALARLRSEEPRAFERVVIEQVGPVEREEDLMQQARALGVEGRLRLGPSVPHAEAFRRCMGSNGLLLLGVSGDRPEIQVPAKLYEYLAARRPILALAKRGGAIGQVLEDAGVDHELADPDDPVAICAALRRFLGTLAERSDPTLSPGLGRFRYDVLSERLEAELRAAVPARRRA